MEKVGTQEQNMNWPSKRNGEAFHKSMCIVLVGVDSGEYFQAEWDRSVLTFKLL